MCITHGRVGEEHARLIEHPSRKALGAERLKALPGARRRRRIERDCGQSRQREVPRARAALHLLMAVDDRLPDEREDACRAVSLPRGAEELWGLIDEARRVVAARKLRVRDDLIEEAQIRHDTADAELP